MVYLYLLTEDSELPINPIYISWAITNNAHLAAV